MMKKDTWAGRLLYTTMRGCTIAVAVLFLFFLMMALMVDYKPGMDFKSLITIVAFSMVISYSGGIFRIRALVPPLRYMLHFLVLAVATFIVLLITTKAYVIGLLLYAFVWGLSVGISCLFRRLFGKEEAKEPVREQTYTSRFS